MCGAIGSPASGELIGSQVVQDPLDIGILVKCSNCSRFIVCMDDIADSLDHQQRNGVIDAQFQSGLSVLPSVIATEARQSLLTIMRLLRACGPRNDN